MCVEVNMLKYFNKNVKVNILNSIIQILIFKKLNNLSQNQ